MRLGPSVIAAALLALLPVCCCFAQGTYSFIVHDAVAPEELIYQQDVSLSVMNDATVAAWSFSLCHDTAGSDICGANLTPFVTGLNPIGGGLFFTNLGIYGDDNPVPGSDAGLSYGIVIGQGGFFFFPDNTTDVIANVYYVARAGTAGSTTATTICNSVGSPQVETVVVCCGGLSIPMGANVTGGSGTVDFVPSDDQWAFGGAGVQINVDPVTGDCVSPLCSTTVPLTIARTAANSSFHGAAGFSLALTYDPAFITVNSISPSGALMALNGGSGPDVFVWTNTGTGISIHCQNTAVPAPFLPYIPDLSSWEFGDDAVDLDLTFDTSSLTGVLTPTTTTLAWGDPGDGSTNSMTVICGASNFISLEKITYSDLVFTFLPAYDPAFVRGDCNDDGVTNIADGIWLISGYLVSPPAGPEGPCAEACDINDDGSIDIADVAYAFMYQFGGGPAPTDPFPQCGTAADSPCDVFLSCP